MVSETLFERFKKREWRKTDFVCFFFSFVQRILLVVSQLNNHLITKRIQVVSHQKPWMEMLIQIMDMDIVVAHCKTTPVGG